MAQQVAEGRHGHGGGVGRSTSPPSGSAETPLGQFNDADIADEVSSMLKM